jgi:hypothetical protein
MGSPRCNQQGAALKGTISGIFIKKNSIRPQFAAFQSGNLTAYSSGMTLTEVLPKPIESGDEKPARKFADFLKHSKHFTMIQISERIAEAATRLGQIIRGNRCITVETAIKIGRHILPLSRYHIIVSQAFL